MGMTIEESKETILLVQKLEDSLSSNNTKSMVSQAIDVAISTMRKYQKIQEIINNTDYIQEDVIRYKMICGVVEDGNDA